MIATGLPSVHLGRSRCRAAVLVRGQQARRSCGDARWRIGRWCSERDGVARFESGTPCGAVLVVDVVDVVDLVELHGGLGVLERSGNSPLT